MNSHEGRGCSHRASVALPRVPCVRAEPHTLPGSPVTPRLRGTLEEMMDTQDQVFAAPSARRGRVVRAALAGGAILLAGWLTALTLGAVGGFDALPELKLGGGGEKQAADQPEAAGAATESAKGSVARDDRSLG